MYDNIEDAVAAALHQRIGTSLDCLPPDCASGVSEKIIGFISKLTQEGGNQEKVETFFSKRALDWLLEIINYALKCPPNYETFRTCVHCYADWLRVLTSSVHARIPLPVREEPQFYSRIFLCNLRHVADNILQPEREVLCKHVLREIEELCKIVPPGSCLSPPVNGVSQIRRSTVTTTATTTKSSLVSGDHISDNFSNGESSSIHDEVPLGSSVKAPREDSTTLTPVLDAQTWDSVFLLLLEILSKGLACSKYNSANEKVDLFLKNFFNIWLLATSKQYPDCSFWKSLQRILHENSLQYSVLRGWSKEFLSLNEALYNSIKKNEETSTNDVKFELKSESAEFIVSEKFNAQQLIHTWYRFFHFPVNPALMYEFQFPEHLFNQIPQDAQIQFLYYSALNLKVTTTITTAVYQFMDIATDSAIRRKLSIGANVNLQVNNNQGANLNIVTGKEYNHNQNSISTSALQVVNNTRSSNKNNASFKSASKNVQSDSTLPVQPPAIQNNNAYPLFIASSSSQASIESVLNAFGDFLFQIILAGPGAANELVYAQAEALTCLLRLFSLKLDREAVSVEYYAIFNYCIDKVMKSDVTNDCDVTAYVLLSSCNLFCNGIRFCSSMVPKYIDVITTIKSDLNIINDNTNIIGCHVSRIIFWKACYHVLLTSIPYLIQFHIPQTQSLTLPTTTYLENIHKFCLKAIEFEKNPESISLVISISYVAIQTSNCTPSSAEGATFCRSTMRLFVILMTRVLDEWSEDAQSQPILTSLSFLRSLSVSDENRNNYREYVVPKLCELIEKLLQKPSRHHKTALHSLIVSSYRIIALWLEPSVKQSSDNYIFASESLIKPTLEAIEYGLSGSKSVSRDSLVYKGMKAPKVASQRSRDAAEFLLNCLIDKLPGLKFKPVFPMPPPPSTESALSCKDFYFVADKERFINIREKVSDHRKSDSLPTSEDGHSKKECDNFFDLSILTPYSNAVYEVHDKRTSNFDKSSTSTMIPATPYVFYEDTMPVHSTYIPGRIAFIPEPLAEMTSCVPERKLLSFSEQACQDDEFSSFVEQSVDGEFIFDEDSFFEDPTLCNEPQPADSHLHSKRFLSTFPLLQPFSFVEKVDLSLKPSDVSYSNIKSRNNESLCSSISQPDLPYVHAFLQWLPRKIKKKVDIFYIPSEDIVKQIDDDVIQWLNMQKNAACDEKIFKLFRTLTDVSNEDKLCEESDRYSAVFKSAFCDISYNLFPSAACVKFDEEVASNCWMMSSPKLYEACPLCGSSVNSSPNHLSPDWLSSRTVNTHCSCSTLNTSANQLSIFVFGIRHYDQRLHVNPPLLRKLAASQIVTAAQFCPNTANSVTQTSCVGSGGFETMTPDLNNVDSFNYVAYSVYVHKNDLVTVTIDSNLKHVSFHPLVDKCVVRPQDFSHAVSESIKNVLFDWSIEHVTPYVRRREFIQKVGIKYRNEMINKRSLWGSEFLLNSKAEQQNDSVGTLNDSNHNRVEKGGAGFCNPLSTNGSNFF